ncbi:flagellar hook-basal body complex protein FliE [Izhakiella capsodis]|uniref:Flagellar hook-basal body complex protein FliE n=1 Tax=Izhakiella capsodis TaxID=1367852 RepID=A0A1I4YBU0_9GAMM|nr:flagellar hook-basal body complex protein FliE [Izhakiella capsodis]SFN35495.1 flagellar hook-basal body complex protein FliE [Izhakiella capsodis]
MVNKISAGNMQAEMLASMQRMQLQAAGAGISPPTLPSSIGTPSFSAVLNSAIDKVDSLQQVASQKQRAVDMGESDDLSGAMIESQKASIAFTAMVQVRNKLTQAFDDVINMPL